MFKVIHITRISALFDLILYLFARAANSNSNLNLVPAAVTGKLRAYQNLKVAHMT